MTRNKLEQSNLCPYHLTARSSIHENFYIPLDEVWNVFCQELAKLQKSHDLLINQFVLMENHYHLLAETSNFNIDKIMYLLQKNVSSKINLKADHINPLFYSPCRWTVVMKDGYIKNIIRYIFQNPLRDNIVSRAEDYPFSTLYYKIKSIPLPFSHGFSNLIDENEDANFLEFINQGCTKDQEGRIKTALASTHFKISPELKKSLLKPALNFSAHIDEEKHG